MSTALLTDERCFWHGGGNYAFTLPVGGLVQPGAGLPETPETKRRLRNLIEVTGLARDLAVQTAAPAGRDDLARVHPESYLRAFRDLSEAGGGELGPRAPFGPGGFEIAALSAGLARAALFEVLQSRARNAYALCRPPGHHCLPDRPNGFCLLANIAIAIRAAQAAGLLGRVAVVDWDVHHGNGTEAIFWDDPEVLTISLHQDRNYPTDTGGAAARGARGRRAATSTCRCRRARGIAAIWRRWTGSCCPRSIGSRPRRSWWPAAMTPRPSIRWGGCWPRPRRSG